MSHPGRHSVAIPLPNSSAGAPPGGSVGSLGTPNPHASHSPLTRHSPPDRRSDFNLPQHIHLVPTRPRLKVLAKECKPCPPWCVGNRVPETLSEELALFSSFLEPSAREIQDTESVVAEIRAVALSLWPDCQLLPIGVNAAGMLFPDAPIGYYVKGSDASCTTEQLIALANEAGFQADLFTDYRSCPSVLLTKARTGRRCILRYGPTAAQAEASALLIQKMLAENPSRKHALIAVDALLRQGKAVDDGSNAHLMPSEAVAIMLLSIAASYPPDVNPDSETLLTDFFLTFGFTTHFDNAQFAVDVKGITQNTPKSRRDTALEVLDPGDASRILTVGVHNVPHILGVFQYCYTAITQFKQVHASQRRAQSPLSTIIGGETFWSRVLHHYHNRVEPFYSVVRVREHILAGV